MSDWGRDTTGAGGTAGSEVPMACSETEQGKAGSDEGASALHATGPRITNPTPPPKHKDNGAVNPRGFTGFSSVDSDDAGSLSGDVDAALERETDEFCDAILRLAGVRALDVARQSYTLFLDEHQSDLGITEHRLAVLRRIQCGEPGAVLLDGKSFLLTEAAHAEELAMAAQMRRIQREES